MKRHSDSFIVTVDKEDNYHLIDHLELNKYALKAQVDPDSGSKYTPSEDQLKGNNILEPKYSPYYLAREWVKMGHDVRSGIQILYGF